MNKQIIINSIFVLKKAIRICNEEIMRQRAMSNIIRREISKIKHSNGHRFQVSLIDKLNGSKETIDRGIKIIIEIKKQRCDELTSNLVRLEEESLSLNEKAQIIGINHTSLSLFYDKQAEYGLINGDLFGACSLHAENFGGRKSDNVISAAISMMMHDMFNKNPEMIDRAFDKLAEINGRPIPRYKQSITAEGKAVFVRLPPKLKVC